MLFLFVEFIADKFHGRLPKITGDDIDALPERAVCECGVSVDWYASTCPTTGRPVIEPVRWIAEPAGGRIGDFQRIPVVAADILRIWCGQLICPFALAPFCFFGVHRNTLHA